MTSSSFLPELLGQSPGIQAVREKVARFFEHRSEQRRMPPVLIQGETGTGKGVLARAMWRSSRRSEARFVDVNCAAIPETLLEAELFGFERGAFTDATRAKPGLFQEAHGGTILLDEVGLIPLAVQAKLLSAIEEREVRRLGRTRGDVVDVWILAATSEDLSSARRDHRFREDLYHRLAVLTVFLPPLRERGDDIVLLAERFLGTTAADYQLSPRSLAPDARAALLAYTWPGNVRELANVIERVVLLSSDHVVTAKLLDLNSQRPDAHRPGAQREAARNPSRDGTGPSDSPDSAAHDVDDDRLREALESAAGNVSRAAALLGVTRNTFRYRLEKFRVRSGVSGEHTAAAQPREGSPQKLPRTRKPEPAPVSASLAPVFRWERRHLSFLVAAGNADDWSEGGRFLETTVEKIESFGGHVVDIRQEARSLLAAFGLEPMENTPLRAALAATAIQKAASDGGLRLGLHAGHVLVGRFGSATEIEHEVKRGVWERTADLLKTAPAGTILVTDAARKLLARSFRFAHTDGRNGDFRLVGRERRRFESGPRDSTFVGRENEISLLFERLHEAFAGRGQVVAITGEPGIGKSRLLSEFRKALEGPRREIQFLQADCDVCGTNTPFFPLVQLLIAGFGLTGTERPEVVRAKLDRGLGILGIEPGEVRPYLQKLLGVEESGDQLASLTPEALHDRTFKALWRMSVPASRNRPLVLAIEDLHWIDQPSNEYLAALSEELVNESILLVVTYRSGHRPAWLNPARKPSWVELSLGPLGETDRWDLIHGMLGDGEGSNVLTRQIVARAGGNPYFLEELAWTVHEQREAAGSLEAKTMEEDPGCPVEIPIPETIEAAVECRIERLPEEARRVLEAISVVGRECASEHLQTIRGLLGSKPDVLDAALAELVRLDFLRTAVEHGQPVYLFKHPLLQEVTYRGIASRERRRLHAAVGRALETVFEGRLETVYDRLAYHFSKSDESEKAADYLAVFARQASRIHALAEADAALAEALSQVNRLPAVASAARRVELVLSRARSLSQLGRTEEAKALLLESWERLAEFREPLVAGRFHFLLGNVERLLGNQKQAAENALRSLEESSRAHDVPTMGRAHCELSLECIWSGSPREGLEHARAAADLIETIGGGHLEGLARWIMGIHAYLLGDFEEALSTEARALAVSHTSGSSRLESYANWMSGLVLAMRGETDPGIARCQQSVETAPDPLDRAVALGVTGCAHWEAGLYRSAIPLLEKSARQLSRFRYRHMEAWVSAWLSETLLEAREIDRAREAALRALEITNESQSFYGRFLARRALGRVALASRDWQAAESHLDAALESMTSIGARFEAGRTRLSLAELAKARGSPDGGHLIEAEQLFLSCGAPAYVERARGLIKDSTRRG